jgi:hypothetical protein
MGVHRYRESCTIFLGLLDDLVLWVFFYFPRWGLMNKLPDHLCLLSENFSVHLILFYACFFSIFDSLRVPSSLCNNIILHVPRLYDDNGSGWGK